MNDTTESVDFDNDGEPLEHVYKRDPDGLWIRVWRSLDRWYYRRHGETETHGPYRDGSAAAQAEESERT
jgi:hypothetical protein